MQFIDSHIHLQDYKANNAPHFIANMRNMGVRALICPSVCENDWDKVLDISKNSSLLIIPALGLHPWYLEKRQYGWEERLNQKLNENPLALIGECGFDRVKNPNYSQQKDIFATHVCLACKFNRSLILHAVKANMWLDDFWKELKQINFVFHSFGGSLELMKKTLQSGGYISFSPTICKRSNFSDLIKYIPADRLLVESDGPYQGNPQDIPSLVNLIAQIKLQDVELINQQIVQNFRRFTNAE